MRKVVKHVTAVFVTAVRALFSSLPLFLLLATDIHAAGRVDVSAGVNIYNVGPVVIGENFYVDFSLKEYQGESKTFEYVQLWIQDGSGNDLYDAQTWTNVIFSRNEQIDFQTTTFLDPQRGREPGSYRAIVRGKVAGDTPFNFGVVSGSNAVNPVSFTALGPDDHGNAFETATDLLTSCNPIGAFDYQFDLDVFRINVGQTANYTFFSSHAASSADLHNSTGNFLGSTTQNSGNFRMEVTLSPGTYYLVVRERYGGFGSQYALHMEVNGTGANNFCTWVSPGALYVDPTSGNWTSSPTYIYALARFATSVYYTMVNTYDGSTPSDPPAPTPGANNGSTNGLYGGGPFVYSGTENLLKKTKMRFVACNSFTCGAPSPVYSYSIDLRTPGAVSVSPSTGSWTDTPHSLNLLSSGASTIYFTMVNTYDGSVPADPLQPTAAVNDGSLAGPSAAFQYYGTAGTLKRTKLRFAGCNTHGCGPASAVYSYSIDLRGPAPGPISVSPSTGSWAATPNYLAVASNDATTIYFSMVNTYDGSTPADPPPPTPTSNNGAMSGAAVSFEYYGAAKLLKKSKLRFVGCNSNGCGPASGVYSYSIDLRVPLAQANPDRLGLSLDPSNIPGYAKRAIVIAHGWNADASTWVDEMARAICAKQSGDVVGTIRAQYLTRICRRIDDWDVWVVDWRNQAAAGLDLSELDPTGPWIAYTNAIATGQAVANYLKPAGYGHFHFIAHSAGSNLIDFASIWLKTWAKLEKKTVPTIQESFLDAYDPRLENSLYGLHADWADNYVDMRSLLSGLQALEIDATALVLKNAYNIDVTPMTDGCAAALDGFICRHDRPYRFYGLSVDPDFVGADLHKAVDPIGATANKGYPLSAEGGSALSALKTTFPTGHGCIVVGDSCIASDSLAGRYIRLVRPATTSTLNGPVQGAAAWIDYGVRKVARFGSFFLPGPTSPPTRYATEEITLATATPQTTQSPSWLTVSMTTTAPTDTMRFDWRFAQGGEAYLRVFVNGVLARELDQRLLATTSLHTEEIYIGGLAGSLPAGTHQISFRLDSFGANPSGAELIDIELVSRVSSTLLPPTALRVVPGDAKMKISFAAPSSDGGSPITGYTATCSGGGSTKSVSGPSGPLVVTGLSNGVAYACSVHANNGLGAGSESQSMVRFAGQRPGIIPLIPIILGD